MKCERKCKWIGRTRLAVRTRLVSPILLYALTTEELATGLMLSWVSSYSQADQTLEGVSWFRHKIAVIATEINHANHVTMFVVKGRQTKT